MRVGYFLAGVEGLESGGIAPYAVRLAEALVSASLPVDVHLVVRPDQRQIAATIAARDPSGRTTVGVVSPRGKQLRLSRLLTEVGLDSGRNLALRVALEANHLDRALRHQGVDLIHCPVQTLPAYSWSLPTVVTLHDVQELQLPEFFTAHERFVRARDRWLTLASTARVLVSYAHVKDDLIRYFQLPESRVQVCPIPVSSDWLPAVSETDLSATRARLSIQEPFLLYPAQTWPHKNHLGLLRALARLRENGVALPLLVCTGRKNDFYSRIQEELSTLRLQDRVCFPGLVSERELSSLYRMCLGVVIPTLYEAGSFPLMEAFLSGAPVICARTTSLPETMSADEFTFDPRDVDDFAARLAQLVSGPGFREANVAHGRQRKAALLSQRELTRDSLLRLYREFG